ncbi:MAG: hypothetical protein RMJ35_12395 [Phycisphaerales bacterium]|nr:hypothetical protein [Phycisphaerales bacterium]
MPRQVRWSDQAVRRQAIFDLPLEAVLRVEIARPLQLLNVFTIGQFLSAWHDPDRQSEMILLFDSAQQARHAVAVCANWLGGKHAPVMHAGWSEPWWRGDENLAV